MPDKDVINFNYWFLSRKRLFIPIVCEFSIFYTLFFVSDIFFLGNNLKDFLISFLIINFWVFIGYIVGKFNIRSSKIKFIFIKIFSKSLILYFFVTLISIAILNIFNINLYLSRELIILFLIFTLLSTISQTIISKNFYKFFNSENLYLFLGDYQKFKNLKKEIKMSQFNFKLIHYEPKNEFNNSNLSFDGIILENMNCLSDNSLEVLLEYKQNGFQIYSLITWCNYFLQRFPPELVNKIDLISEDLIYQQSVFHKRIKRAFDVFFAVILISALFPILIITAFLIYIEDGGPIFFSQLRTGYLGKPFKILKFRTMKNNSEKSGPQWAKKNDPRITRIGSYLRLFRIDELPQLIFVLKGTMTLIGPRPERPEFDILLKEKVPHYSLRYLVTPGLSGWAQVNYPYGSSVKDSINKLSFDLYYLKNISIILDMLIFLKTIRLVFNKMLAEPKE